MGVCGSLVVFVVFLAGVELVCYASLWLGVNPVNLIFPNSPQLNSV